MAATTERTTQSTSGLAGSSSTMEEDQVLKYYKDEMAKSNTMLYVTRISFVIFVVFAMYLLGMLFLYRTSDAEPQAVIRTVVYQHAPKKQCIVNVNAPLSVPRPHRSSGALTTPANAETSTKATPVVSESLEPSTTEPPPFDDLATLAPSNNLPDHLLFCFYNHSSYRRKPPLRLQIKDIPVSFCTHVVYSSAGIDSAFLVKATDQMFDVEQNGFTKFIELRQHHRTVKFLLNVGETRQDWRTFRDIVSESATIRTFAQNLFRWIVGRKFDGVVINWRYPRKPERWRLNDLIQEVKAVFSRRKLLVAVSLPHAQSVRRAGFDVAHLSTLADFLLFDMFSDHVTPMPKTTFPVTDEDVTLFPKVVRKEMSKRHFRKACIVLPLHGLTFTLRNRDHRHIGAGVLGPGLAGKSTKVPGILSYNEICAGNWSLVNSELFGTYAVSGIQWVGYHDAANLRNIMLFLRRKYGCRCFGMSDVGYDDSRGDCGLRFPLLQNCYRNLQGTSADSANWLD